MPKTVPTMPGQPAKPLPYSPVVEANGIVWLCGQTGHAPGESSAVPGGIRAEARAALENMGITLRAVGLDYRDVVKNTVYLTNFDDFEAMNEVYREFFPTEPPARATVQVVRLASDYSIEIVAEAAR